MMHVARVAALVVALATVTGWSGAAARTSGFTCEDFLTQTAAQHYLENNPSDPYGLDPDGDGLACEEMQANGDVETVDNEGNAPSTTEQETTDDPPASLGALPAPPAGSQEIVLNGFLDGEMLRARVGDTQETIRLIGVDTPDVERWECLAFPALDRVRQLLALDATYYVETDPEVRDGEDRLYAHLWYPAEDGYRLLSETLLAEGYAGFVEPDKQHAQYTDALENATQSARQNKLGIWSQCEGSWHLETQPCEPVDQAVADYISANLEGGLWIRGAQAVRSPTYVQSYLIAGEIEGPGWDGDNQIGVWWVPGGADAESAQLGAIEALAGNARQVSLFESQGILESAEAAGYNEAMECVVRHWDDSAPPSE